MAAWTLSNDHASFSGRNIRGTVPLDNPARGIRLATFPKCELMVVGIPNQSRHPIESHVRGCDLISTFPPREGDRVKHQTYFRIVDDGFAPGVDLILSVQTSQLQCDPLTQVDCVFGDGTMLARSATQAEEIGSGFPGKTYLPDDTLLYTIYRPADSDQSLVFFSHPSDSHRAKIKASPRRRVSLSLFPHSMEKGVIRRAYFQARIVPRLHDERSANSLMELALSMEPPLTV